MTPTDRTLCKRCGERPALPAAARNRPNSARCSRCMNASPAGLRARRAYMRRNGNRRIYIAGRNVGFAATAAQAAQINAHIRRRTREFSSNQPATAR